MTFKEIQDAVILDRFTELQRGAVKFAINSRYGRVWALEPWAFKRDAVTFSLLTGQSSITLEDLGLQKVDGVWSDIGNDWEGMYSDRPEDFYTYANQTGGRQYAFTVLNNEIRFDRALTSNTNFVAVGELKWQPLVEDTDVPLLPEEYQYALVQGAAADMLLREADPTWQAEEKQWTDQIVELRLAYMGNTRQTQTAYPSWP